MISKEQQKKSYIRMILDQAGLEGEERKEGQKHLEEKPVHELMAFVLKWN